MKNLYFFLKLSIAILSLMVSSQYAFAGSGNSTVLPGSSTSNITICNNQLPYHWNGLTCLTAGSYSATLTGSNGADSIATLNLSVINVGVSITNAIVCDNELPYHWNGNSYSVSGTYSVTLTSSSGCDSVPILSLTINHVVTSTTNHSVCSNQLPFNWNGNNYSTTGTYIATLISAAGCDSIATLNLLVNSVSSSTSNASVCINTLPYNWNGNSYPAAGTYSVSLVNSVGCDSVATLILSTKPITSSNTFINVCSNQLPFNWNNNNYGVAGNYSVALAGSNGCDSIATLHLTVLPASAGNEHVTVCTAMLPYSWNGNSYNTGGTYAVTLTNSNGCDSVVTLFLTSVPFLTSSATHFVCNSDLPYTWNGTDYFAGGSYTASFVTAGGCDSIATLQLTVGSPSVNTDSISICESALPYNWHGNIYTSGGTYEVNPPVAIDACHSVDSVVLTVQLIIPSTTLTTVCNNHLPFVWNGQNYSATGVYGVLLTSSSGCDSLANLDLTVAPAGSSTTNLNICSNQVPFLWNGNNFNASGVYPVTLVSSNGCDSIATLNLTVNNITSSNTDLTVCNSQIPYTWNGNSYSANGTYIVTLTNSNGCDSIASLHFVVESFLSSTDNITVCSNQLPYSWNGNSYSVPGVYSIDLTSSSGCDSIATLNLLVNDVITSTTNVNTCTNQLPYNWNGNSYNSAGTYTFTLITAGGCDSIATLHLTVNDVVSSTTDIIICNNQLPYSWNGNSYPFDGTYLVTLTSSSGCDSIATLNLSVTDILTSTTNVNVCPAQLPYSWNGNSYPAGGTYSVTLSNPVGCDSVPVLSLTVIPYVTSTTDITICNNQFPYSWNGQTYAAAGTYSVLLGGSNFCDSLATLNLSVSTIITSSTTVTICDNLLPYAWNGNSYVSAGIYPVTLTSSGGCDSIATLNLMVNTVLTSTTNVIICTTQLPYAWNGNSYPSAGDYSVTLTSSVGCDSIASLHLVVNPILTSITDLIICSTQLPYTWNGNSYPAAGNYSVTLTSNSGCDSIATLHLLANPVLTSSNPINICDNQLPYSWNGNSYPAGGNYSVTLTSSSGCDSVATLQLTVSNVVTSSTTVSICNNQLPYTWNGQPYSTAGAHVITLVSSAGCDSIATLNLTINLTGSSITNATTCTNQLPYLWNGMSYAGSGNYSVTLTGVNGCDSVANLELIVNPVATSTTIASTCSGQLPFIWNGQNYSTAGIYNSTLSSSAGCDSIATLDLTLNPTPPLPGVVSPISYCQYETTAALNASTTTTTSHLLWYGSATGGTGSQTAPVPSSANAGITNYYVSQVDGPCEGPRAIITVTVNSKPDLGPDRSLRICFGKSANLSSLFNSSGYTISWSFNQLPVADPSAVTVAGEYQLVAQNISGCIDTVLVHLDIQPELIADAGDDADAEYNVPYQLSGSGGGNYQWSPALPLNNPFIATPLATLTENTTFLLTVTDEIGCADVDTVKLRVLKGPTFYVPTAFTPNADGLNDIFKPTPVGIASLDFFRVFNRYGELVYETQEIGKGWDGTYKGVKQNIGNYVWAVKGVDRTGTIKFLKGNVVLIR